MADNLKLLSLYLIAVAAIRFLRYLLSASGMTPIPILVSVPRRDCEFCNTMSGGKINEINR